MTFADETRLIELLNTRSSVHDCKTADCQIYPDGTRRRNPYPDEDNAAEGIPLLQEQDQLSKDGEYTKPKSSKELKELHKKVKGREMVE